ncbi:MAG: ROK family protein, partial [Microlunatus sp.]|nr:ROK family protein [Microlunatus sp.]
LDAIVDAVGRATEHADADGRGARLAAVGLAVPAILDHDQRPVRSATFPQWTGVDLQSALSRRLGCPVAVENDLKLAAYAEHHIGGAAENMIFVQLGRRISMALLVGGRILQGSHRMAGELGAQRGMRWTRTYDQLGLLWSTGRDAKPLFERAAAGDRQAIAEIDDFCAQITSRLATVVLALDPELLVVGGGLSLAGDLLLDPLRRRLEDLLTTPARPKVAAARLATSAAVTGALGHAFDQQSEQIFGIPAVPPPWYRLRTALRIRPRSQAYGSGTQ